MSKEKKVKTQSLNWPTERVLITGASSGLGKALAIAIAKRRGALALVGRNEKALKEVCDTAKEFGSLANAYCFDLHNTSEIKSLIDRISTDFKNATTILINNAGYSMAGFIKKTPLKLYEQNFEVNFFAPLGLIHSLLPVFLKQGKGEIVNIMNSASFHSFPGISSYCSSKAALATYHESLKIELNGSPVKTLYVNPGSFTSNYVKNTSIEDRLNGHCYKEPPGLASPSTVAEKILGAIETGQDSLDLSNFKTRIGNHLRYWSPKLLQKLIISQNKNLLDKN